MKRTLVATLAWTLLVPVVASAETEIPPMFPEEATASPNELPPPPEPEPYEADEEEFEEEFCGGEPTTIDLAWELVYEGELAEAQRTLVVALQDGTIHGWQRPDALALLAETQLRRGKHRAAARNYQRARELDPALQSQTHTGLAIALHRLGRHAEAVQIATSHLNTNCLASRDMPSCYGAQLVVAQAAEDEVERFRASTEAAAILAESAHGREDLELMQTLLAGNVPSTQAD